MSEAIGEAMFEDDLDMPPQTFRFIGGGEGGRPRFMTFSCPGKLGQAMPMARCMIALKPQKNENGASWDWDGNREAPTISPSIDCKGCWHGWIKAGRFSNA